MTIGNFDGVHLGHRALLAKAEGLAHRRGADAVAMTFEPHPAAYLRPTMVPPRLTPEYRKIELVAESNMDAIVIQHFDQALAQMSAESFIQDILVGALGAKDVVVGYDFRFGAKRAGDADMLKHFASSSGYEVHTLSPVSINEHVISSSMIRRELSDGHVHRLAQYLGRPFDCDGVVIHGQKRGRELGFPTANLDVGDRFLPTPGIYAVWVQNQSKPAMPPTMGAASLGTNPTFEGDGSVHLEVYLLDFDADLYGDTLRVSFIEHIRPEQKFGSVETLIKQMNLDVDNARRVLSAYPIVADGQDLKETS